MRMVKTLKNCKAGIEYHTRNYELFKFTVNNRGEESGVDVNNANKFKEKREKGTLLPIWRVEINMDGKMLMTFLSSLFGFTVLFFWIFVKKIDLIKIRLKLRKMEF